MSTLQNVLFINNSPYMDGPQTTFINAIREKLSQNNIDVANSQDLVSSDDDGKSGKKSASAVACTSNNEQNRKKAYIICNALEYLLTKQERIVNQIEPMLMKIEEISPSLDHKLTNAIKKELNIAKKKNKNNYNGKNSKTSQKCDADKNKSQDVGDGQDVKYLYKSDYFPNNDSRLMLPFQYSNELPMLWKNQSLRKFIIRDQKKTLNTRSVPVILMNKLSTVHTNPIWNLCNKEKKVILIQIPGVTAFPNLYSTILSRPQMNLHTASPIENHLLGFNRNSGDTRISKMNHFDEDNRETNSFRIRVRATRTLYNGATNDSEENHFIKPNQSILNKQNSAEDENDVKCINQEQDEKGKNKEEISDTISLHIPQNVFTDAEKENLQKILTELLNMEVKRKLKKQKLYSRSENILEFLMGMSKNYLQSRFIDKNTVKDKQDVVEYLYNNIKELREYGTNTEPMTEPVTENMTNTESETDSMNDTETGIESGTNTEPELEQTNALVDTASITSKMKQRENLFKINREVFNDFENKIKYVNILKSSKSNENLDQKLSANAVVGDNIDVNILNVMKAHNKCNKEISKLKLDAQEEIAPVTDESQEGVFTEDFQKPKTNESNEINDASNQAVDFIKTEILDVEKQELPPISIPNIISTPHVSTYDTELDDQPFISYIDHNLLMSKLSIKHLDKTEKESSENISTIDVKETLQAIAANNITKNVPFSQRNKNEEPQTSKNNNIQQNRSMSNLVEKLSQQSKTTINKLQKKSLLELKLKDENSYFGEINTVYSQACKSAQPQEKQGLIIVKMSEPLKIFKHHNARKVQSQHKHTDKNDNFNTGDKTEESQSAPKLLVKEDKIKQTDNKIKTQTNWCANADNLFKSISELNNATAQNKTVEQSRSTPKIGLTQSKTKYAQQFSTHPDSKKTKHKEPQNNACVGVQNSATEIKQQTESSGIILNKCLSNIALNEKSVERCNSDNQAVIDKLLKVFEENKTENKGSDQKLNKTNNESTNKINCKNSVSTCEINDLLGPSSRDSSVDKNGSKQITTVMAFNKTKVKRNVTRIPKLQPIPRKNKLENEKKQTLKEFTNKNSNQLNTTSSDCSLGTSEEIKSSELSISPKTEDSKSISEMQKHKQMCNELMENILQNALSSVKSNQQELQNEDIVMEEVEECKSETSKEEREPWGTNVCNIVPVHFKKPTFFTTIPNGTIWNQEPRNQNQIGYFASDDKKFKKHKKYRYETKEVDSANGKKVRITYLVLDNN